MRLEKNYSAKKLLYKFKIDLWGTFILQNKFHFRITKRLLLEFETLLRMRYFKQLRASRIFTSNKKKIFRQRQLQIERNNFKKQTNKFFKKYKKPKKVYFKKKKFSKFYRFRYQQRFFFPRFKKKLPNSEYFKKKFRRVKALEQHLRKKYKFLTVFKIRGIKLNFRYLISKLKFTTNRVRILKNFFLLQYKLFLKNKFLKIKYDYYLNKIEKKNIFSFDKSALRKIFFYNLFKYSTFYNNRFSFVSKFESIWIKSHLVRLKFILPKDLGKMYHQNSLKWLIRRPYKKLSTINFHNKVELLKQLNFFCFSTLSQTRKFLRRVEFLKKPNIIYLGLEGCFINLLFRTNLFLTTKQIYTFIKLGAFKINEVTVLNPYKVLSIFDSFSVNKKFFFIIWSFFLDKVRKNLILVNIPNYLDYDYKLLNFFIWRLPTETECRFTYSFPFFRPFINLNKEYSQKFQNISSLEYSPPRNYKF